MMDLRDMQLLAALARHRHFARAAGACGISQPAFSARIRNLERTLGGPIVLRGNRFMGFTKEGEVAIKWARRLLADADGMRQEFSAEHHALEGELIIGCIPTALVWVARTVSIFQARHRAIKCQILARSSHAILQDIQEYSLDAGITYLDKTFPNTLCTEPLYEERFVALVPENISPNNQSEGTLSWREAATLPLCLLVRDMRNRRILDEIFTRVGAEVKPMLETDDFTAILAQVMAGTVATIAPESLTHTIPLPSTIRHLPMTKPTITKEVGLIYRNQDLLLVRHFARTLADMDTSL